MPYRLIHFSPGLVEVEISGHIDLDDVAGMRDEGELMLRHAVEPFDAIVDATAFTGLNPLALTQLRELPLPPNLRAVAVMLRGWQLLASKALPRIEGLAFVGSFDEARTTLPGLPALAIERQPQPAPEPLNDPLPQLRRLPPRPLPPAHRLPHPGNGQGLVGAALREMTGQMHRIAQQLEQLRNW